MILFFPTHQRPGVTRQVSEIQRVTCLSIHRLVPHYRKLIFWESLYWAYVMLSTGWFIRPLLNQTKSGRSHWWDWGRTTPLFFWHPAFHRFIVHKAENIEIMMLLIITEVLSFMMRGIECTSQSRAQTETQEVGSFIFIVTMGRPIL